MKNFKKIIFFLLIALSFTSCKKSLKDQGFENTIEIFSNNDYNFIKVDTIIEREFNGTDYVFVVSTVEYLKGKSCLFLTQSVDVNSDIAINNLKHANKEDKERSKRTEVYTILQASGDISDINRYLRSSYGPGFQFRLN